MSNLIYSIPTIITALYFVCIGVFVLSKQPNEKVNRSFFKLCLCTFLWQGTWAILFQTENPDIAIQIIRVGYFFINFVPLFFYEFAIHACESNRKEEAFLKPAYVIYSILACLSLFSTIFIAGYYKSSWGFYPRAGILHPIHVVMTVVVILRSLQLIQKKLKNASAQKKMELRIIGVSLGIFSFSAVDYLCNYGATFYPFGLIFLVVSLSMVTYAITKHELMDITIFINRGTALTLVVGVITITYYLLWAVTQKVFQVLIPSAILLSLIWIKIAKPVRYFIQTPLDKKFIKGWYNEHALLKEFLASLATCKTYPDLIPIIDKALRDHMEISTIAITFSTKLEDPNATFEDYLTIYEYPRKQSIVAYTMTVYRESHPMIKINLGPKLSEDPFNQKDYDVLHTIELQLSQAIYRIDQTRQYETQRQEKQLAEAANQFKTRFLAQLCHDFRTPLHTILGFSQHIQDHPDENPPKSSKFIHDSADLLLRSVTDMIDIERIEKGDIPMQEETIHLPHFLSDIDAIMRILIQEKPIAFALETDPALPDIESDPALLKRILINLLSNAIKFTEEGRVTLSVHFENGLLRFVVQDTGIGFDEQKIPHLFEAYTQENPQVETGGVGLGLSIVHAFVTRLNGAITVKSVPQKGSEFCVQIPVKFSPLPVQNQPIQKVEKDISQTRILVCDDTAMNRLYAKMILRKRVIYTDVDSGEAALEIIKTQDFDIIFLDVHMPEGINGVDTCKLIRKFYQEKAQTPPIICAITAQPNLHNQETIAALGFDTFLRKPFTELELLGFITLLPTTSATLSALPKPSAQSNKQNS